MIIHSRDEYLSFLEELLTLEQKVITYGAEDFEVERIEALEKALKEYDLFEEKPR